MTTRDDFSFADRRRDARGEKRTGRTTPRKTKRALEGTTDGAFLIERKRVERLDNNEEEKREREHQTNGVEKGRRRERRFRTADDRDVETVAIYTHDELFGLALCCCSC